jgi:hypothetical protein
MNDRKLETQRKILDFIYKAIPGIIIQEYDKPDFKLKYKDYKYYFGVEVTEFYFDETSARLRNVSAYLDDLLTDKKFLHKKDRRNLKVQKVTIISKSGENKGEPEAVIYKLPSLASCRDKIDQLIREKNNRFSEYDKALHHINLIIYDAEGFLFRMKIKDFYNIAYSSDIVRSITNSNFREIYFITRIDDDKRVYFPLKIILFLSRIFAFSSFIRQEHPNKKEFDDEEYYRYFIEFLDCQGFKDIKIIKNQNKTTEIVYGNIGFFIKDGEKVMLKDYQDYELPPEAEPINIEKYYHLSGKSKETIRDLHDMISFETEIGYDVK